MLRLGRGGSAWFRRERTAWVLRALYCVAGCGGVFAQAGTMSSTLLLPEQAASSAVRTEMTTMRSMTAVLAIGVPPNEDE